MKSFEEVIVTSGASFIVSDNGSIPISVAVEEVSAPFALVAFTSNAGRSPPSFTNVAPSAVNVTVPVVASM